MKISLPRAIRELPSQSRLHELFNYNLSTGIFYWKVSRPNGGRPRAGDVAGTMRKFGYVYIGIDGLGQFGAHRLAWIYVYGDNLGSVEIDHIDCNPSNNAIANLRLATSSQQKQNRGTQSNNRSGLKGAYYHACHKGKKWRSQIKVGSSLIFLGYFHTAIEAHLAYTEAAHEHFGEFARAA